MVEGDLMGEFQAALDAVSAEDPSSAAPPRLTTDTRPLPVIVVDEYIAARVVLGRWPAGMPENPWEQPFDADRLPGHIPHPNGPAAARHHPQSLRG
jgi:hypothetical protein